MSLLLNNAMSSDSFFSFVGGSGSCDQLKIFMVCELQAKESPQVYHVWLFEWAIIADELEGYSPGLHIYLSDYIHAFILLIHLS